MMSSIRSQLEMLDAKMAELQQAVDPEDFAAESVDLDIDIENVAGEVAAEVAAESVVDDDLPFDDVGEPEEEPLEEPLEEPVDEKPKPTVNDSLASDCAWRRDMPGAPVRDIRSAISLNDRVIFINLLFGEDAQVFVDALNRINSMETLDQVVGYVTSEFPAWDLNSELVYRFMMAVRRKVK